ncbi:MAG: hypothetical protein O7J95_20210 [Planctomycetota bacterium]|nr:hypothetical protein [Planctomycetota bacterium]
MLRKLSRTALVFGAAVGISLAAGSPAMADSQGTSVGINFAAEEPDGGRSDVNGAAGLFDTVNWNNLEGASGGPAELFADTLGSRDLEGGGITVTWESNNTWSSTGRGNEENNDAPPGDDRNLMTGYLDTTATSVTRVTVSGLQAAFDGPYDVYVYMKGGVNDRGGRLHHRR